MYMPYRNGQGSTIPSSFAPDVTEGDQPIAPAASPWVRPMRNAQPGELQQTGQTLMQAGNVEARLGNTIGDRVQETMDDAQTKAAETQFLQSSLPLLGQYRATQGLNATQQFEPTAQAISKARQDARQALTNPIQQNMYDRVTNDHLVTFGQQMADHESVQRVQYGRDQAQARAQSLNTLSTLDVDGRNRADSNFAKYGAQSDAEVLHYAQLSGIGPDSPQADQLLRKNRTERYQSVISSLLDQHAYNEASDFFTAHKGEMDVSQAEVLGNAVKSASMQVQGTDLGNQAIESLGKVKGPGPLTQPIPSGTITTTNGVDGIDIHTAPGTSVRAPLNGTVTKVWNDKDLGLSMQMALPNGYTATFSGLGAANYNEGQRVTEGQALGISGKDPMGRAAVHYAITDPDGKYVDPRQAPSAPFDPANFSSADDAEKAVDWINKNVDDEALRRVAVNRVESLFSHNRRIENEAHQDAVKQATDWWFGHSQSLAGLPADVMGKLSPEEIDSFNQQTKAKNDVNLLASWIQDPTQQTVDNVRKAYAQGRLSDSGYLTALRGAMSLQGQDGADPQKAFDVKIDNQQIENTLLQNGFQNLAQPKKGDNDALAQKVKLVQDIKDQVDAAQTASRRVLTRQEKQEIIDRTISDSAYVDQSHLFGAPTPQAKRVYFMTPQELGNAYELVGNQRVYLRDIPAQERQNIIGALNRRAIPVTQQSIANLWVQAGRPGAAK